MAEVKVNVCNSQCYMVPHCDYNLFLTKIVITVTPVSESNKSLEAVRYNAAFYCEISRLVLTSHHSSLLNPPIS